VIAFQSPLSLPSSDIFPFLFHSLSLDSLLLWWVVLQNLWCEPFNDARVRCKVFLYHVPMSHHHSPPPSSRPCIPETNTCVVWCEEMLLLHLNFLSIIDAVMRERVKGLDCGVSVVYYRWLIQHDHVSYTPYVFGPLGGAHPHVHYTLLSTPQPHTTSPSGPWVRTLSPRDARIGPYHILPPYILPHTSLYTVSFHGPPHPLDLLGPASFFVMCTTHICFLVLTVVARRRSHDRAPTWQVPETSK